MTNNYDFCGWATRNNLKCSDGRVIMRDAFKENNGMTVPLVWNHQHNDPNNVLGHAILENREDGVFTYGFFNDTESGNNARLLVEHGDVKTLSIYANNLSQNGSNVMHGCIREVSLVLAGANPGAKIVDVISHSADDETGAEIYSGEEIAVLTHAENDKEGTETMANEESKKSTKTVGEIVESMTDEQKAAMYMVVEEALKQKGADNEDEESDEEKEDMKHNAFESTNEQQEMFHTAMQTVIADGKRYGSLKESYEQHKDMFLMHDEESAGSSSSTLTVAPGRGTTYGINNVDYLYPDAQTIGSTPDFYKRNTDWVAKVMNGVHHTPFSRIKSIYADITADEARAKGYITGHRKKEEVIVALKRVTTPTTIYKKQKMDRDDIVDITDFDVVAWLKGEMRVMLNEEIARAILIGDGRSASSEDKISELNIRPIAHDDSTYTIYKTVYPNSNDTEEDAMKKLIKECVLARVEYKGSGNPTMFTTEETLTKMLLLEDTLGHRLYDTEEKLATALRVSSIVTVPVMEGQTVTYDQEDVGSTEMMIDAIIVNLTDYNVGADKGGAINMFEDFDIDYNQQKYLIETRCSGALTKPKSAIVIGLPAPGGDA